MTTPITVRPHLALFAGLLALASVALRQPAHAARPRVEARTAPALPVIFEPNVGQAGNTSQYLARGAGYDATFAPAEATLALDGSTTTLRMRLVGAAPRAKLTAEQPLRGKVHYLRGRDPRHWRRNVPTFGKLRSRQVYPGVDLVHYGTPEKLEHDFVVAPGADPGRILVEYSGADDMRLAEDGGLELTISGTRVVQHPPVAYQQIGGRRVGIPARYRLEPRNSTRIEFELAAYDRTRPLIIDPVLDWSIMVSTGSSMVRDASGALYFLGSKTIPGNPQTTDVVVTKLVTDGTVAGTTIVDRAQFGGSQSDVPGTMTLAPSGELVIAGITLSDDFPVVDALQPALQGTLNTFVARLSEDGSRLTYSTYFGSGRGPFVSSVAVDSSGGVCIAGSAGEGLPVVNAVQSTPGNESDAFVTRFSPDGAQIVFSTYLGGNEGDDAAAVDADAAGNVYIAGYTTSANFPTFKPLQRKIGSFVRDGGDAFVAKFSPAGVLRYSTFLGGEDVEAVTALSVDPQGYATVVGGTGSSRFPTFRALQPEIGPYARHSSGGSFDAFVSRLKPDGSGFVFSTYLGGGGYDQASALARDGEGNLYVAGEAGGVPPIGADPQFPVKDSLQPFPADSLTFGVGFVAKLPSDGSRLLYSTLLGGENSSSYISGMALDGDGRAYVTGFTMSSRTFPLTDRTNRGGTFLARLGESSGRMVLDWRPLRFRTVAVGQSRTLRLSLRNSSRQVLRVIADSRVDSVTVEPAGRFAVEPGESAKLRVTFSPTAPGPMQGTLFLLTTDQRQATVPVPLSGTGRGAP
jgi:hypothetical protein